MTTELDFLVDDANTTDQDSVHVSGVAYPFIQWIGGDSDQDKSANVRWHGGWFAQKDKLDLTGVDGWTASHIKRKDKDGKKIDIDGFYAKSLSIAIINQRHRYEVRAGDGGQPELFSHSAYDAANARAQQLQAVDPQCTPKKKSQFLCMIKGISQPVSLTLRGTFAKAMSGQSGLIQVFDRTVMAFVAGELRKSGTNNLLPMRRFWINVGIAQDAKGNPDFRPYGPKGKTSDLIVPTLWGVPNPVTMDYIKSIHTGAGNKEAFDKLYSETLEWSKAWDTIAAKQPDAQTTKVESDPVLSDM